LKASIALSISVLNADFSRLEESLKPVDSFADSFHVDIMDGTLTPIISFGSWIIPVLRSIVKARLDIHLYIRNPLEVYSEVLEKGASRVIVDFKAAKAILARKKAHTRPDLGVYLLPTDEVGSIDLSVLQKVSVVNVITVNSLMGGQEISWDLVERTRWLDELKRTHGLSFDISVDGGINEDVLDRILEYPVNQVIVGSAILTSADPSACASRFKEKLTSS